MCIGGMVGNVGGCCILRVYFVCGVFDEFVWVVEDVVGGFVVFDLYLVVGCVEFYCFVGVFVEVGVWCYDDLLVDFEVFWFVGVYLGGDGFD